MQTRAVLGCARRGWQSARAGCGRTRTLVRWLGSGLCLILLSAGATGRAGPDSEACAAWPGEIDPLPTVTDPDPFTARWARLRAAELTQLATALERDDPAEAYRIWLHTQCIVPDSSAAARAQRLEPIFVAARRPARLEPRRRARGERSRTPPEVAAPLEPQPSPAELAAFDRQLATAEQNLDLARFREVVRTIDRLRSALTSWPAGRAMQERRARIEVLGASALVALGRSDQAAANFARALEADPDLVLDARTTSPKILSLLEEVRRRAREARR